MSLNCPKIMNLDICKYCKNKPSSSERQATSESPSRNKKVCYTENRYANSSNLLNIKNNSLKAAYQKNAIWPQGTTINVCFLEGQDWQKNWVRSVIEEKYAFLLNGSKPSIKFNWFMNPTEEEKAKCACRITFNPDLGAWSYIGIDNADPNFLYKDGKITATMNLGWLDEPNSEGDPAAGSGGVVVHEFGHLLGLIHEHSRGDSPLKWNCQSVINGLAGPPNNWDCDTIYNNVFYIIDKDQFNGTSYDKDSIMHYYFDSADFCENPNLKQNNVLSPLDYKLLSQMYPSDGSTRISSDKNDKGKWILYFLIIMTVLIIGTIIFLRVKKSES